ncbi:MAG: TorF family putative porin [Luteimonas sp.]|nr:TorF family putative porin [Luteimonas sp.]
MSLRFHLLPPGCACALLLSTGFAASAAELGGSAALTTDYVWRGSTQTQGDPAVQAGVRLAADAGFYASIWGSNVEFAPEVHAGSEFDLTLGWAHALDEDWALDVNVLHYRYPSTSVDLDWTELNGTLAWKDRYWASLGYSNQALGSGKTGLYAQLGAKFPINDAIRLEAAAGRYALRDVDGDGRHDSYVHGLASVVWAFRPPFEARLTAHVTDSRARRLFGDDLAGSRIEAALQTSF